MEMKELLQRLRKLGDIPMPDSLLSKIQTRLALEKQNLSSQKPMENKPRRIKLYDEASPYSQNHTDLILAAQAQGEHNPFGSRVGATSIRTDKSLSEMSLAALTQCCT